MERTHLIGDRADSADPSHQVGEFTRGPAAQKGFEEARRFVDLETEIDDLIALDREMQGTLSLHTSEGRDLDRAPLAQLPSPLWSPMRRNAG